TAFALTPSPGLDPGRGQPLGPLLPRQSGLIRRLRPVRFPNGPARQRRGGRGCDRVRGVAARSLDQRPQHSGGRPGAAACAARPPWRPPWTIMGLYVIPLMYFGYPLLGGLSLLSGEVGTARPILRQTLGVLILITVWGFAASMHYEIIWVDGSL